ncbi:MAG: RBBP9/YdeN family alpha/beta hydrolase [Candidatus Dojkabacteria bacterium]
MKNAIILQGWYQKTNANWYPWLKDQLRSKGYEVHLPDLPTIHTDRPDLQIQLDYLFDNLEVNRDTILIGHSLGSLLALRVAEKVELDKIFLVAGWDFNDLTEEHQLFWEKPVNHSKIIENVGEIYCYSSDNDPYITAFHAEEMCKRLKGTFVLVEGAGHFTTKDGVTKIDRLVQYL